MARASLRKLRYTCVKRWRKGRERNREDKVTDDYVSKRDVTFRVAADMIATRTRGCDRLRSRIFAVPADKRACCKLLYRDCTFSGLPPLRPASINAPGEMHYSEDAIRLNCVPTNRWKCLTTWLTNNRIIYNYVNRDRTALRCGSRYFLAWRNNNERRERISVWSWNITAFLNVCI